MADRPFLYTVRGTATLLWDVLFGTAGAALCALAIPWIAPKLGVVALVTAGPLCAVLAIFAGHEIQRAVDKALRGRLSN